MYGYDKVPPTLPGRRRASWVPARPSLDRRLDGVRHALAGAGLTEAVTPALVDGALLERLGLAARAVRVVNPVSEDQDSLRTSLIPSLLEVAVRNRNGGRPSIGIFEIGRAYLARPEEPSGQPDEPVRLAVLCSGLPDPDASRQAFFQLKGALERAFRAVAPAEVEWRRAVLPLFHPGRCARVELGNHELGALGELHPTVLQQFDLEGRAVAAELALEPLLAVEAAWQVQPLPRFPAVNRDLAVVVPEEAEAAALLATLERAGGDLMESARAFDEYRGGQLPPGRKSVAFSMSFRSAERTLTDAEVDGRLEQIRAALRERHAATFRDVVDSSPRPAGGG